MTKHHLHLISDSTGGTLNSMVKACRAQFHAVDVQEHFWPLVRSPQQLEKIMQSIRDNPGAVLYTLVDDALAQVLERHCHGLGVPVLSIMQPVLDLMSRTFGQESLHQPGLQYQLNADYFARMDAVDYALHHDDGQKTERDLDKADVILVGVSRTSKTPTCVYLANRGVKAANIPLVPGVPIAENILTLKKPLFVGLTASPERLVDIRRNRLRQLGEIRDTSYQDIERVEEEVRNARKFYTAQGWPVIDVTRRSVEETAAEVLALLEQRRQQKEEKS